MKPSSGYTHSFSGVVFFFSCKVSNILPICAKQKEISFSETISVESCGLQVAFFRINIPNAKEQKEKPSTNQLVIKEKMYLCITNIH